MRIRMLLTISLLTVATAAMAEQSALEGAATQMLKQKATEAAPQEAVQGAQSADKSIDKAKTLKESAESRAGTG
ncbi:MAG: hypothetical protein H6R26_1290 [Proteobacteria bacterium]|nr:hypothetical protein [Pseudomonadota bacterium]